MQRATDEVSFLLARAALLATEPLSVEVLDAMGLDAVRQDVRSDGALGMGVVVSSVSVASQMGTEAAKSLAAVVAATVAGGVFGVLRSKFSKVLRRKLCRGAPIRPWRRGDGQHRDQRDWLHGRV